MSTVTPAVLHRIVKAYDIRGRVDDELTEPVAYALGRAAAQVLDDPHTPLAVGHDMRTSSPVLAEAFMNGVQDAGRDVISLGLTSTDMVWFASGVLQVAGAMITASHNPPSDNGIKLCQPGAKPVSITTGLATIRDLALTPTLPLAASQVRGTRQQQVVYDRFVAHVATVSGWREPLDIPVVVDAGNGMGGLVWPLVSDAFSIPTDALFFALDGNFPHHPANPLDVANLAWLSGRVIATKAAIGFAFDGDADRVFAVDENGEPVSASAMGAVLAQWLLRTTPNATVLANAITSRSVERAVTAAGGTLERTRVGHSFIKQDMARTGAIYACEHSGHHYFRANFGADSGVIAAVMFLQALAQSGVTVSELVAPFRTDSALGEQSFTVADPQHAVAVVAAFFEQHGELSYLDGVTVSLPQGWLNLRPSNTEAVVRLNIEANDADTVARWREQTLRALTEAHCLHSPNGGHHA
jgi:phosphomannomutase